MVAAFTSSSQFQTPARRGAGARRLANTPLIAEVTLGGGAVPTMTIEVGITRIGRRSMDLIALDGVSIEALRRVRFAWVAIDSEHLAIKPLVEVVSVSKTHASVRYRHLFPQQQAELDRFNAR